MTNRCGIRGAKHSGTPRYRKIINVGIDCLAITAHCWHVLVHIPIPNAILNIPWKPPYRFCRWQHPPRPLHPRLSLASRESPSLWIWGIRDPCCHSLRCNCGWRRTQWAPQSRTRCILKYLGCLMLPCCECKIWNSADLQYFSSVKSRVLPVSPM